MSLMLPPRPTGIITCGLPLSRFSGAPAKTKAFDANTFTFSWSPKGDYLYAGRALGFDLRCWVVSTSWEIDSTVYNGRFFTPYADTDGVWIKPDGSKVIIHAHTGLLGGHTLSYSLPTPFLWTETGPSQPVLLSDISHQRAEFKHLGDISISEDGLKLISYGNDTNTFPYEMDFGTAWDAATLTYGVDNKIINAADCFIPKDGTCLYRRSGQTIYKYKFNDSWELASLQATLVETLDLSAYLAATIRSIFMTNNRLYVMDDTDVLYQFNSQEKV